MTEQESVEGVLEEMMRDTGNSTIQRWYSARLTAALSREREARKAEIAALAFEMDSLTVFGDGSVRVTPKSGPYWGASSCYTAIGLFACALRRIAQGKQAEKEWT